MRRAAVIGGGVSGLIAAYRLARAGFRVDVFEREAVPGGLASSFETHGLTVDRYYHFICPPDAAYLRLIGELGLDDALGWAEGGMAVFHDGRHHAFGTPGALARFAPLPPVDRTRFGLAVLRALGGTSAELDHVSAREWLVAEQGARCYEEVWRPLLELKFGRAADRVSAAWMRARIERVGRSRRHLFAPERLGYLRGGTRTLVHALLEGIEELGGRVVTGAEVTRVVMADGRVGGVEVAGRVVATDIVVSTVPTPVFLRIATGLSARYMAVLDSVAYDAVACWVLLAREPLADVFWLNVNDARVPIPGVITYTHLDPMPALGGLHLHYVPLYLAASDPRRGRAVHDGRDEMLGRLDLIRPGFSRGVEEVHLFEDRYAQPVYDVGFASRLAPARGPRTPVTGLYRTDMAEVYPADRSVVNAAEQASSIARAVAEDGEVTR